MIDLIQDVHLWAADRGIYENSNPHAQLSKLIEEVGEVASCVNKRNATELELEIGDLLVTVILLAGLYNLDPQECLQKAYNKISKRSGNLVDGVFIKEGDE